MMTHHVQTAHVNVHSLLMFLKAKLVFPVKLVSVVWTDLQVHQVHKVQQEMTDNPADQDRQVSLDRWVIVVCQDVLENPANLVKMESLENPDEEVIQVHLAHLVTEDLDKEVQTVTQVAPDKTENQAVMVIQEDLVKMVKMADRVIPDVQVIQDEMENPVNQDSQVKMLSVPKHNKDHKVPLVHQARMVNPEKMANQVIQEALVNAELQEKTVSVVRLVIVVNPDQQVNAVVMDAMVSMVHLDHAVLQEAQALQVTLAKMVIQEEKVIKVTPEQMVPQDRRVKRGQTDLTVNPVNLDHLVTQVVMANVVNVALMVNQVTQVSLVTMAKMVHKVALVNVVMLVDLVNPAKSMNWKLNFLFKELSVNFILNAMAKAMAMMNTMEAAVVVTKSTNHGKP